MKRTKQTITRYTHKDFYVDIVDTGKFTEAWITHPDYGISMFMFAYETEVVMERHFLELVEANFDEYAAIYSEEYGY